MAADIEQKLSAARTRLILDRPFLGALVLRLPLQAVDAPWCPTTATDARTLYYNPGYIAALSLDQAQFVLAHEALHCALSHFARRGHRARHRWDIACDLAVNPLLVKEGLPAPPGALVLEGFEGMSAEEIYPYIDEASEQATLDRHLYEEAEASGAGAGSGDRSDDSGGGVPLAREGEGAAARPPAPLQPAERERLAVQWRQRLAGAAQQALRAGKLGGGMARLVGHLLQPQLPWRMLLARYVSAIARDDYSYTRPSRRESAAIMPSLRSAQVDVLAVVDTSGSIAAEEIAQFLSELNALKAQVRARVTLHACDAQLSAEGPWTFEPWEALAAPRTLSGGGGTRFTPIFEWMHAQGRRPDLVVYFTDAQGEFPARAPDFPVLWLVKGKAPVPWGERIQLN
jgi:predicted metal-dependent peptidase